MACRVSRIAILPVGLRMKYSRRYPVSLLGTCLMQLLAVSWFEMLIPVNNSKVSITYPPELLKLN
ncbi:hypothetical protein CIHG_08647 [Coccidioides immitis H538.4]|uniref:Uncharacterized protein n=3 Tax=Coccidioides immitis TaxID=5501 RepID=A0A0J8RAG7_COCIT|nr:hypothetical protein CIRG_09846 [Coccidioides immitis RMSCC 2394]KMU81430.1 hypothetical protein CISG_09143 [Coccidioides immitis RMSCC 3703]KMU90843.1 hypothetical protein CIHG_08647 [Coccidioides immitis H538.4]